MEALPPKGGSATGYVRNTPSHLRCEAASGSNPNSGAEGGGVGNPTTPFTRDAMNSMKGPLRNRPPDFSAAYMHEIDP